MKIKDKKLIISLFENSKKSNRQIAKEIQVSKETVASRINYFLKSNIIKGFSLKLDYEKLGFTEFNLYIKLKNSNKETYTEIIKYFENHPKVSWIGKAYGKYDLKVALYSKRTDGINNIIKEISLKFGGNIQTIDYLLILDKHKGYPNLFLENILDEKIIFNKKIKKPEKKIKLDQIDKSLIYEMGQGEKTGYVKLSSKFNLTPEAIKYRVKRLENNNIILGNSIVLNGHKFNKLWSIMLLNIKPEYMDELKIFLKTKKYLSNFKETSGIWNFTIKIFANDIKELHEHINEIRENFSEHIREQDFLLLLDFYKFPKVPECVKN